MPAARPRPQRHATRGVESCVANACGLRSGSSAVGSAAWHGCSARAYTARLTAPDRYTTHWSRPRWMLAALLASLGTIGPFAVDTYLPAFAGIAQSLAASPLQMQQTLSAYLLGIAVMNLFHGALSDGFGRRPVILAGIGVFALASIGSGLWRKVGEIVLWLVVAVHADGLAMMLGLA